MRARVLKPLRYAADHINIVEHAADAEIDVAADVVPGLVAGGFIEVLSDPVESPQAPPLVEIPEGWADLPFGELQALAILISRAPVKAKADAVAIVEAELAARAAAASDEGAQSGA